MNKTGDINEHAIYSAELNYSFSLQTISNIYYEMCQCLGTFDFFWQTVPNQVSKSWLDVDFDNSTTLVVEGDILMW